VKTHLLLADKKYHNVVQNGKMAMPVKTNQRRHDWSAAGERPMENQTVTIEDVRTLSDSLAALPKDANQNQLAEAIANASLVQIAAVSNHGERITGSSERAVAAWFNEHYPPTVGELNWFETKHGDKTDMSKTIAGNKSTVYKAWSSANNSVKFGRVQGYGAELAKPMLLELIAALPEDERAEAYYNNHLTDPATQPEEETDTETDSGSGKPSRTRDLYERSIVELGKLYRALNSAENDAIIKAHAKAKELQDALVDVTKALKALGAPVDDDALVAFMKSVAKR
jgi:hypothetical protein